LYFLCYFFRFFAWHKKREKNESISSNIKRNRNKQNEKGSIGECTSNQYHGFFHHVNMTSQQNTPLTKAFAMLSIIEEITMQDAEIAMKDAESNVTPVESKPNLRTQKDFRRCGLKNIKVSDRRTCMSCLS
jgi:hypothetical protein